MGEKSALVHLLTLTLFSELKGWVIERRVDMSQLANPREKVSKILKSKKIQQIVNLECKFTPPSERLFRVYHHPPQLAPFFTLFNPTPHLTRQPQA